MVIPSQYRCDACAAIAYQIQRGLLDAELGKLHGLRRKALSDVELIETLDEQVCVVGRFRGYGTLGVAKEDLSSEAAPTKVLNGDGIPHGAHVCVMTCMNDL